MGDNNRTWADFWAENKPLAWFITIALTIALGYLIYNKWIIEVGKAKFTPPSSPPIATTTDTSSPVKPPPKPTPSPSPKNPEGIAKTNNPDERHGLTMSGHIAQPNGQPAANAKVTCNNCLTYDGPVSADQSGNFRNSEEGLNLIYQNPVECRIEFSVGAVQVTKAAQLVIAAWYDPGRFEFINIPVK